jgi:hypothetical protein
MMKQQAQWPPIYSPVVEARYVGRYTIWLRFADGTEGEADLSDLISSKIFEPLRDVRAFKRFHVLYGTIIWNKELDVAPESLYRRVREGLASTRPV